MAPVSPIPRVLIIAGSDSGGGAGIQADLKTVSALGAFGMTAITALTAQNTTGVRGIFEVPPDFVELQIAACVEDIGCDAVKTGMLTSIGLIETVAASISRRRLSLVVVDPVMVAKSGAPLLHPDAVTALKRALLPLATVTTPNLYEAAALAGRELRDLSAIYDAARAIHDLGPQNVLIKAGHLAAVAADVFFDGREFIELRAPRVETTNTHGTGCILASAIAAGLAHGRTPRQAVEQAKEFVTDAIANALPLGHGHGPANPMGRIKSKQT